MISFSHIYYDKHESGFLLLPMIPLFLEHAFVKNILCTWKKIFERELCILKIWVFFGLATQYYLNVIMYTEKNLTVVVRFIKMMWILLCSRILIKYAICLSHTPVSFHVDV